MMKGEKFMTKLTKNDIAKYILKIQLNFENAYRFNSELESTLLLGTWFDILNKYPKEVCDVAVNNALAKAKFAPRIGEIVEEIKILNSVNSKTNEELWAELMDIKYSVWEISRYLKYPQHYEAANKQLTKIYKNMSDELKLYAVNLSILIEISELSEENLSYEKNRFFRNMPELRKHREDKITAERFLNYIKQNKIDIKSADEKDDI